MDGNNNNQPQPPQAPPPMPGQAPQPMQPAPMPQPAPQPGQPGTSYQMPPKKGLSKGALWGIIGGAVGLILLIVGVVLAVVLLGGPSKADYRAAATYMSELDISSEMNLSDVNTADEAKEEVDAFTKKADEHFDKLRSDKVMRDDEVKKAFDAYEAEWKKAKPAMASVAEVMGVSFEMSDKCSGGSYVSYIDKTGDQAGKEFDEENGDCMKALEKFKDSDNKSVAEYAKAHYDYLKEMRNYTVGMANRYSSRDYSSPSPKYPTYPSVSNPGIGLSKELSNNKVGDREQDLYDLLREKARD